jgi:hypothetical protein
VKKIDKIRRSLAKKAMLEEAVCRAIEDAVRRAKGEPVDIYDFCLILRVKLKTAGLQMIIKPGRLAKEGLELQSNLDTHEAWTHKAKGAIRGKSISFK